MCLRRATSDKGVLRPCNSVLNAEHPWQESCAAWNPAGTFAIKTAAMFAWTVFAIAVTVIEDAFCYHNSYDPIWQVKSVSTCTSQGGCTYDYVRGNCGQYYYSIFYNYSTESSCRYRCNGDSNCGAFRFRTKSWWYWWSGRYECYIVRPSWNNCIRSPDQKNLAEEEEEELITWSNSFPPPSSLLDYENLYSEEIMMSTAVPEMTSSSMSEMASSMTYEPASVESMQKTRLCACRPCMTSSISFLVDKEEEMSSRIQEIIAELKVEKRSVSATVRKVTSAKDKRPSSQVVGFVGIVTLLTAIGSLLFSDIVTMGYKIYKCSRKLRKKFRNRRKLHVAVDEGLPSPVYASDFKEE